MSLYDIVLIHEGDDLNMDEQTALDITVVRGQDEDTGDGDRWGFSLSRVPGVQNGLLHDTLVVEEVTEKSWALAAGLVPGDVITEFDGIVVSKFAGRIIDMLRSPKGNVLKLKVLPAPPTLKPDTEAGSAGAVDIRVARPAQTTPPIKLGMHISHHFAGGHYVSAVAPDSLAEEAGVRQGDLIVSVNGSRKEDVDDDVALAKTLAENQTVTLSIIRRGDWMGCPGTDVLSITRATHQGYVNGRHRRMSLGAAPLTFNKKCICGHLKLQI